MTSVCNYPNAAVHEKRTRILWLFLITVYFTSMDFQDVHFLVISALPVNNGTGKH